MTPEILELRRRYALLRAAKAKPEPEPVKLDWRAQRARIRAQNIARVETFYQEQPFARLHRASAALRLSQATILKARKVLLEQDKIEPWPIPARSKKPLTEAEKLEKKFMNPLQEANRQRVETLYKRSPYLPIPAAAKALGLSGSTVRGHRKALEGEGKIEAWPLTPLPEDSTGRASKEARGFIRR